MSLANAYAAKRKLLKGSARPEPEADVDDLIFDEASPEEPMPVAEESESTPTKPGVDVKAIIKKHQFFMSKAE